MILLRIALSVNPSSAIGIKSVPGNYFDDEMSCRTIIWIKPASARLVHSYHDL